MPRRNVGRLVGADLDWFIIPVRKIAAWGVLVVIVAAASIYGYRTWARTNPSAEERARLEIETAADLLAKATRVAGTERPGSNVARGRALLTDARSAMGETRYEEASRLAIESQSFSRQVLGGATDDGGDASLIFVEGDVGVQRAGRSTFASAKQRQPLFDGDFIKTGRTGSAEIMFTDGTLFTIRPNSLFEVRRPSASDASGSEVKMVSGAVNVYTSGSPSTVATDDATASIERDSRILVDVARGEKTEVTTYRGKTTVSTSMNTVVLEGRQRVVAAARTGALTAPIVLPESPQPLLPADNRTFDLAGGEVELKWSRVPDASRYRIQISRSRLFVPDANDVDLDDRTGLSTRIKVSREGSYFWRLAAINRDDVSSDWSAVRRFRMTAQPLRAGTGDTTPPELSVVAPQQMGNLFLIFGKTEKGAVVTVNSDPADVAADGTFKKTITIERDGYAMLVIKAVDASGNETIRRMRVFVETL